MRQYVSGVAGNWQVDRQLVEEMATQRKIQVAEMWAMIRGGFKDGLQNSADTQLDNATLIWMSRMAGAPLPYDDPTAAPRRQRLEHTVCPFFSCVLRHESGTWRHSHHIYIYI